MTTRNRREAHPSRVTAAYESSTVSFLLREGATFGDLAEHLGGMEDRHGRGPIAVGVKFDA
jgi:hypothetical protein